MSVRDDSGLEDRYFVRRHHDPTGKHADCRYFVLDPKHDPLARMALARYAGLARSLCGDVALHDDLLTWLGDFDPGMLELVVGTGGDQRAVDPEPFCAAHGRTCQWGCVR